MRAYIQTINKEIPDDWLFAARLGFKNKGWDIKHFEEEDIENIPCTGNEVVVAYIEPTIKYFELNDILLQKPLNIPDELNWDHFLHRKITHCSMQHLKENYELNNIFVKPADRVKGFSSGIITQHSLKKFVFADVLDDTNVMCSTQVDFISEYRCFIHKGEIKAIQYYSGDFKVFPNSEDIEKMVAAYANAPVAYTLDVGVVLKYGTKLTLLVECNDMWSVAHYGIRDHIYSTLLRDRWFELTKVKNASNSAKGTESVG